MSSINTGYQSQNISTNALENQTNDRLNRIQLPVYKYLDIDSTYRNRTDYPDPNSFIVRNSNNSNVSGKNLVVVNLPVYSFPFSQLYVSFNYTPLSFQTPGNDNLTLDTRETTSVQNFYAGYFIESIAPGINNPSVIDYSNVEYTTISSYNANTQVATFTSPLSTNVINGGNYVIRKNKPIYLGNIVGPATQTNSYILSESLSGTSFPIDSNSVYYIRIRKSTNSSLDNIVVQANVLPISNFPLVLPNTIQLSSPIILNANDSVEIIGPGQNIITSLRYASGGSQSIQAGDYELELLWLSVPNQILDVGYGGTLDRYPYIYCSIYTGSTNTTQQVLYSNNPNTSKVLFKVPVNEYFGDTSFITLKDSKAKQTVYFDPSQDLFFELTLPDGTVISFNELDNMPPYPPNPFLQINILVSMKKI